jgi:hypothetical protein
VWKAELLSVSVARGQTPGGHRSHKKEENPMAKQTGNIIMHGASGILGGQIVIRQRDGHVILSKPPAASKKEASAAQKAQKLRFQRAVLYGQRVLENPGLEAEYKAKAKELQSAYNVAVADLLHAPNIAEIDVTNYHGHTGDTIRVQVTDDFEVKQVALAIHNSDGSLVEEGEAVRQENVIDWRYTATAENAETSGDRIEIRAYDRPDNLAEEERTL